MRDTLVNIKGASETDYSQDLKLNTAFNIGEQNNHQGAELMRQTLKRNFDIDIKYYAMVDFETFATGIDTLFPDGVKINAKFSTIDGKKVSSVQVPDDLRMDKDGNVPTDGDWIDSYDLYGGQGIEIDFDNYQSKLKELGFR